MTGSAPAVMSALIVRAIVDDLVIPPLSFRGTPIRMIWDPTVALMQRIATGERADGILAIDWAIDELAARNLIVPSSRRPFAKAALAWQLLRAQRLPTYRPSKRCARLCKRLPQLLIHEQEQVASISNGSLTT